MYLHSCAFCSHVQRQDLRDVYPAHTLSNALSTTANRLTRNTVCCPPENQHVLECDSVMCVWTSLGIADCPTHGEEECHARRAGGLCDSASSTLEAQEDADQHHTDTEQERPDHHRVSSAVLVQEERREQRTEDEHEVDDSAEKKRKVSGEADIQLQDRVT